MLTSDSLSKIYYQPHQDCHNNFIKSPGLQLPSLFLSANTKMLFCFVPPFCAGIVFEFAAAYPIVS